MLRSLGSYDADVHRAGRHAVLRFRSSDAGDADPVVCAEALTDCAGHRLGCFRGDHPKLLDHFDRYPGVDLLLGLIGDEPAFVVLGGAGHIGQHVGQQPARHRLHRGQRSAALVHLVGDVAFERVLIAAPDRAAEDPHHLLFDRAD